MREENKQALIDKEAICKIWVFEVLKEINKPLTEKEKLLVFKDFLDYHLYPLMGTAFACIEQSTDKVISEREEPKVRP